MEYNLTTEQVKIKNNNPSGLGGFGDNPQNRNNGGRYPRSNPLPIGTTTLKV